MQIELLNVGIIKSAKLSFVPGLNLIVGASSSGKSTLLRALQGIMTNSFQDSSVSFGEKKMAVKVVLNGHSVTYVRDLDNPFRKSAYQIDGKLYTKLGRNTPDELVDLFKLSPLEIDGEKVSFNFSSQFSAPFLLLGSQSLLYSILTYRSSFDITKINDLYTNDYKQVKHDLSVVQKTKETLEKTKEEQEAKLDHFSTFPKVFQGVQKLKEDCVRLDELRKNYALYLDTLSKVEKVRDKITHLQSILQAYVPFLDQASTYSLMKDSVVISSQVLSLNERIHSIDSILSQMVLVEDKFSVVNAIMQRIKMKKVVEKARKTPTPIDFSLLNLIHSRQQMLLSYSSLKDSIEPIKFELEGIHEQLQEVGVCPLCGSKLV